jgi:antitoxin component of MazEF toxin-antitoxin module
MDVARAAGLVDGEKVEIETQDGDLVVRRRDARGRQDAEAAAEEIIAESRVHSLGGVSIRELQDDGRRG